ncbi:MAG: amino acid adenylation domain-containing protein, partial [Bryobacteraceae bacterium]|nr:amino acid adenylation domain-containing protein [Bryobacteraceae bacterium]
MTLLAAYNVLLYKYSGQSDLVVGTPVAGRTRPETEASIGFFVNTLALRTSLAGNPTFRSVLARVRDTALGAYAHQDLPFERLVEELQPERDSSWSPLFQTLFTLQTSTSLAWELNGLQVETDFTGTPTAKFDLSLAITNGEIVQGVLNYSTDLFDEAFILRMAVHFRQVLDSLAYHPDTKIEDVSITTAAERIQAIQEWNQTATEYPRDLTLVELFEQRAQSSPDAVAIEDDSAVLTYGTLDLESNRVAHYLRSLGVGRETAVGVCLERSPATLVAILGVLKSGGAYVPLDPDHPMERKLLMLNDTQAKLLLTRTELAPSLQNLDKPLVCIDAPGLLDTHPTTPPDKVNHPEDLAYVMYTSGSTGRPKGIAVAHRGVSRLVLQTNYIEFGPDDRIGMVSNPAFDASTFEIWGALLTGGALVVIPSEIVLAPKDFAKVLRKQRISTMFLTAAVFRQTACEAPDAFQLMTNLLAGGDIVDGASVRSVVRHGRPRRLVNGYGPTENTTFSCCYEACSIGDTDLSIPIGQPIANSTAYILDGHMQPVPPGIVGELYVGGDGLARGYVNRPNLTAETFLPNPFATGLRLYRTGDLARYQSDGTIEFLGRADQQVKIRGFRIELEEIHAVCSRHPGVRQVAVVVREDEHGNKYLVAYVVPSVGHSLDVSDLRSHLARQLPGYMIPNAIVELAELPLNSNGKLDRRALPLPVRLSAGGPFVGPRTASEEAIAAIFAEVLRVNPVGVHDNFFELGGHSLSAMQVVSRLRSLFNRELPLRALFEAPTVAGLSDRLHYAAHTSQADPITRATHNAAPPASFAQQRLLFLQEFDSASGQYNVSLTLRLKGSLSVHALSQALEEIARRHEVLRTHFKISDSNVVQIVSDPPSLDIPLIDLSDLPEPARRVSQNEIVSSDVRRAFNLVTGPVWRQVLIRLADEDHCLVLTAHHIAIDGWSLSVLGHELASLYDAYLLNKPSALPELPVQYSDYAVWQQTYLKDEPLLRQLDYWTEQLNNVPAALELPTIRPRPPIRSDLGASHSFHVPASVITSLKAVCREENSTLFMALLAVYNLLLFRHTGQTDLLVGTPVAGRGRREIEQSIGFFVNTLVLRGDVSGDPTFRQLLARSRATALDAYSNQDVPVERLVEELAPQRDLSRPALFQTMLVLQNTPTLEWQLQGLHVTVESSPVQTSKFDLTLLMSEKPDGLDASFVYSTELIGPDYIGNMAGHFVRLLFSFVEQPDQRCSQAQMLSESELQDLHRTNYASHAATTSLADLFARQVERTPDAQALSYEGQIMTYRELDLRSSHFAATLKLQGVGCESIVAIPSERTPGTVVAILGTLKAGAAYAPYDSSQPPERLRTILEDLGAAITLEYADVSALERTTPDAFLPVSNQRSEPSSLAYVLFTSGSTGRPKGVAVENRQIVNYVLGVSSVANFASGDSFALIQPLHVDASATFLFGALCNGGCLHILGDEQAGVAETLAGYVEQHRIDHLKAAPSHLMTLWNSLQRPESLLPRKSLFVGGEPARLDWLNRIKAQRVDLEIFNQYGPTETTVGATIWRHENATEPCDANVASLGQPIPGVDVYLLDIDGNPVPAGVTGELCIGGANVTRGYLGNPTDTALRYLPNPFSGTAGDRLYCTGDLAKRSASGNLEFLGRRDNQVKIRGYRVELGEIESALGSIANVRECAVGLAGSDKILTAYLCWKDNSQASFPEVRETLRARIPEYMVP